MKVLKFGGSSVAKPENIRLVTNILKDYYRTGEKFVVVFSAFGGITDSLQRMSAMAANGEEGYHELVEAFSQRHLDTVDALLKGDRCQTVREELENNHEVLKNLLYGVFLVREASPRTMDYVLSFGERNSAFIISHVLQQEGIQATYLDARRIIKTDKSFGNAGVDEQLTYKKIREYFSQITELQVVTGFVASAKGGLTTTLGRGGSDYTAALLAGALDAELVEIWTDVNGVLTADPRRVKKAFTLPSLTYAEAMELSHFGAKVIYPPTIQPAMAKGIPLLIKNTFKPAFHGTRIEAQASAHGHSVTGISSMNDVVLLTTQGSGMVGVPGTAARLFTALAQAGINIILITQGSSEHSISFAVKPADAAKAKWILEDAFAHELERHLIDPIKMEENLSVVAVIGERMRYRPGISGRLFRALGKNGINVVAIAQGSSERNISVVVQRQDETKALNALHEAFFLSDVKELHLFMVGVGLIGSTLIEQILRQADYLREKRSMEVRVVGLANTRKMVFDEEGIDLKNWKDQLEGSEEASDMKAFVARMRDMNLSNSIFLDNTADDAMANYYEDILDASISISTPNKAAASSAYLRYERLKTIAEKRGVQYQYETNVGAGLPVISTLEDLRQSGDRIHIIEGILSGSLSFIFNNLSPERTLSSIVREAAEKGLTEPDPRVDLSGHDVRRKLVILARETGLPLELDDVLVEGFLPDEAMEADGLDEFYQVLESWETQFAQRVAAEADAGRKLRFMATLDRESGKAVVSLKAVDGQSPFYDLSGSDNMIVFRTERYRERPLVVRGPGAGAEVTAAGVFAEVLKIGNYLVR